MVYRLVVAKHRSRDEWARLVARWRASGESGRRFADRHGLSTTSLYTWGRRLAVEGHDAEAEPSFTEVRVVGAEPSVQDGRLEVVTRSGRAVRVLGEVDVDQLRAVLEAVEGC